MLLFRSRLAEPRPDRCEAVSHTYIKQSLCYPYYVARAGGKMRRSKALPSKSNLNAVITLR